MTDPTIHPPDSILHDYCDENVSEEMLIDIERHLNECGDCSRRVVAIVRNEINQNGSC